jgi:hypothetical protein
MFKAAEYLGDGDDYSPVLILKRTFTNKKEELFITFLFSLGFLFLCSFAIFYFERDYQPGAFKNIVPSIGWVFGTLTSTSLVEFQPVTLIGKILYIVMIIIGVVIVGLPIGIITGSFVEEIAESKKNQILKHHSSLIVNAFCYESSITIRKLVNSLGLPASRKVLDVDCTMAMLQFSQGEIFEAVGYEPTLRIRACKQSKDSLYEDNFIIENFIVNTSFGGFIKRNSNIHVISSQSVVSLGAGHFSHTLAYSLGANYYSNEFYSSATLKPETQINFAVNELFMNINDPKTPSPLKEWMQIFDDNINSGDIVIYIGTSASLTDHHFHILCGGEKGDLDFLKIRNPIYSPIEPVREFYSDLEENVSEFGMSVTSHTKFANTNSNHLSQYLHNQCDANVVAVYLGASLLEFSTLEVYYKVIGILSKTISHNLIK